MGVIKGQQRLALGHTSDMTYNTKIRLIIRKKDRSFEKKRENVGLKGE